MTKLLGYKKITSKKSGKQFCVASIASDPTPRDKEQGLVGQKVEDIFLPEDQLDLLRPSDIGKELIVDYQISQGRAFIVNVTVK